MTWLSSYGHRVRFNRNQQLVKLSKLQQGKRNPLQVVLGPIIEMFMFQYGIFLHFTKQCGIYLRNIGILNSQGYNLVESALSHRLYLRHTSQRNVTSGNGQTEERNDFDCFYNRVKHHFWW